MAKISVAWHSFSQSHKVCCRVWAALQGSQSPCGDSAFQPSSNIDGTSPSMYASPIVATGKQTRENHAPAYKCCLEMIIKLIFYWPNRVTSHILLQSRPARKEFLKFMVSNNNVHFIMLLLIRSFKFRH